MLFLAYETLSWASRLILWEQVWISAIATRGLLLIGSLSSIHKSHILLQLFNLLIFCYFTKFWSFLCMEGEWGDGGRWRIYRAWARSPWLPDSLFSFAQWRCVSRYGVFIAIVFDQTRVVFSVKVHFSITCKRKHFNFIFKYRFTILWVT